MRAVWIDNGNDPDYARLLRYGIDQPYFDPRDPRVSASYLESVAQHVGIAGCGIYAAWNWLPAFSDPRRYAEWIDAQLRRIGWLGNAAVCADIEKGANGVTDANFGNYVGAFLQRWRQLRPKRETSLTIEGMQGGLFTPANVAGIVAAAVRVAPQFYTGTMAPLPHSPILDLLIADFPGERLDGMYDAAALPWRWRGFAFTQGRLS